MTARKSPTLEWHRAGFACRPKSYQPRQLRELRDVGPAPSLHMAMQPRARVLWCDGITREGNDEESRGR